MHYISKYTFVEVDFSSNLDNNLKNTYQGVIDKTSDANKSFETQNRFIPPYFFKDELEFPDEFLSLLQLALKNDRKAQYKLSHMYFMGYEIERDMFARYWWLLRAASNGHKHSQQDIATSFSYTNHFYTDVIPRDIYRSMEWWNKFDSQAQTIQHFQQRFNCFLSEKDKDKSLDQLIAEADELLSKAYQKRREEEQKIERDLDNHYRLKKFKRTRNPTKEQLRENFDPFIFHPKRK